MTLHEEVRSRMRGSIAYFGGTFDPPHQGHATLLRELSESRMFREIWCAPSFLPSQKQSSSPYSLRAEWVKKLLTPLNLPLVSYSNFEERIEARYTIQVLESAKKQGIPLTFVMGTDQFLNLETWKSFPEILGLSHWWIPLRKGMDELSIEKQILALQEKGFIRPTSHPRTFETMIGPSRNVMIFVPTTAEQIQSSELRARKEKTPKGTTLLHKDFLELTPEVFELWKTL